MLNGLSAQFVVAPQSGSAEDLVKPVRCKSAYAEPCKTFVVVSRD